jgi:hypothetical protein
VSASSPALRAAGRTRLTASNAEKTGPAVRAVGRTHLAVGTSVAHCSRLVMGTAAERKRLVAGIAGSRLVKGTAAVERTRGHPA